LAIFGTAACGGTLLDDASRAGASGGSAGAASALVNAGGPSLGGASAGGMGGAAPNGGDASSATTNALDPSFGESGFARIVEPVESVSRVFVDLALDSEGGVFVLGTNDDGIVLFHLNADGALDAAFGRAGFVFGESHEEGAGLALDPKGNLLLVGSYAGQAMIRRFTATGEPDPSFGMMGRTLFSWDGDNRFFKVLVKSDGSLVAMGKLAANWGLLLGLMDKDGVPVPGVGLEPEFGTPGVVTVNVANLHLVGADLVEQAAGAILLLGMVNEADRTQDRPFWFQVDAQGLPDSSFRRYPTPGFVDVPIQSSSVLAVTTDAGGAVTGWASNGNQLLAFDQYGTATAFSSSPVIEVNSVAVDRAGRVVAVGSKGVEGRSAAALARFQPTGALDTSLTPTGILIWYPGDYSSFSRVRVLPDGRVLAGGVASKAFVIARYLQ